jgi:hypothetical protein
LYPSTTNRYLQAQGMPRLLQSLSAVPFHFTLYLFSFNHACDDREKHSSPFCTWYLATCTLLKIR